MDAATLRSESRNLRLMIIKEVMLDTLGLDSAAAIAADNGDTLVLRGKKGAVRVRASGGKLYAEKVA